MNPDQALIALQTIPYECGGGDYSGADCWGIVELWYSQVLGIQLNDRQEHQPGHSGLQAGFNVRSKWHHLKEPQDHCLVIMRAGKFQAGHVGIFYQNYVLHTDQPHGCILQPIGHRLIAGRITQYLGYIIQ